MGSGGDRSEGDRRESGQNVMEGIEQSLKQGEELFCSSDRGGEEESEGVCGGFDS